MIYVNNNSKCKSGCNPTPFPVYTPCRGGDSHHLLPFHMECPISSGCTRHTGVHRHRYRDSGPEDKVGYPVGTNKTQSGNDSSHKSVGTETTIKPRIESPSTLSSCLWTHSSVESLDYSGTVLSFHQWRNHYVCVPVGGVVVPCTTLEDCALLYGVYRGRDGGGV